MKNSQSPNNPAHKTPDTPPFTNDQLKISIDKYNSLNNSLKSYLQAAKKAQLPFFQQFHILHILLNSALQDCLVFPRQIRFMPQSLVLYIIEVYATVLYCPDRSFYLKTLLNFFNPLKAKLQQVKKPFNSLKLKRRQLSPIPEQDQFVDESDQKTNQQFLTQLAKDLNQQTQRQAFSQSQPEKSQKLFDKMIQIDFSLNYQVQTYKWVKPVLSKSRGFYEKCVEVLIKTINEHSQLMIARFNFNEIHTLLQILNLVRPVLNPERSLQFAHKIIAAINQNIDKPQMQKISVQTYGFLQLISLQLSNYYILHDGVGIKQVLDEIQLLTPRFGFALIFNVNDKKYMKQIGTQILNHCVNSWNSPSSYQRAKFIRINFINQQRLWNFLTNHQADFQIVQMAPDLFQYLIGRDSKFQRSEFALSYHDVFFKSLPWKPDNLRNFYFKNIKPQELRNSVLGAFLDELENIQEKPEFYSFEFMQLMDRISSTIMKLRSKKVIEIILAVSDKHGQIFCNPKILQAAQSVLKRLFENLLTAGIIPHEIVETYYKIIKRLAQKPNLLVTSICKSVFGKSIHRNHDAFTRAINKFANEQNKIEAIIQRIAANDSAQSQFQFLLKSIIKNVQPTSRLKQFNNFIVQCFESREAFTEMIQEMPIQDCQHIFKLMYQIICTNLTPKVHPSCLEILFYEINRLSVHKLNNKYKISSNPTSLKFINQIYALLEMPLPQQLFDKCAQIISNAFTSFTEEYETQGRLQSVKFMVSQSNQLVNTVRKLISLKKPILGYLLLMKKLMFATQTHGTGKLKPSRAVIASSLIKIKIQNKLTYYQTQTVKIYEKMVPSNMTFFELMNKIAKKFNRFWHEIILEHKDKSFVFSMQMNGLTLDELRPYLNADLYARSYNFVLRKEPLMINDDEMNPNFVKILKEWFCELAPNGKMGPLQVQKFILKVTSSVVELNDPKLTEMMKLYASKETGFISEQSFIQYYKNACITVNGLDLVWKNISRAGHRTDFSKQTEPIRPLKQEYMYRFHIKNKGQIYELLFELLRSEKGFEAKIARQLLDHLPVLDFDKGNSLQKLLKVIKSQGDYSFQKNYFLVQFKDFLAEDLNQKSKKYSRKELIHQTRRKQVSQGDIVNENQVVEIKEQNIQQDAATIARSDIQAAFPLDEDQRSGIARIEIGQDQVKQQSQKHIIHHTYLSVQDEAEESNFTQMEEESPLNQTLVQHDRKYQRLKFQKIFITELLLQALLWPKSQQKIISINSSVHILRSMMNFPSLNTNQYRRQNYPILKMIQIIKNTQPNPFQNNILISCMQLLQQCVSKDNFILFQPLLALCIYNKFLQSSPLFKQYILFQLFNRLKFVRNITLNFLIFYSIKYEFPFNFLQIDTKIDPERCQQWLIFVQFYVINKKNLNFQSILMVIKNRLLQQNKAISQKSNTTLIKGYIRIMHIIFSNNLDRIRSKAQQAFSFLTSILHQILDNSIRSILYDILFQIDPQKTLKLMHELIKSVKLGSIVQQKKTTFVGIKNLGSTCYMNSIIQQFFMIQSFRKIILNFPIKNIPTATEVNGVQIIDDFLYQLQKMYVALEHSQRKSYHPKEFCLTIKDAQNRPINTSIQEDAHQFINRLFGKIQRQCKDAGKLALLQKIFLGKTICEITCNQCKSKLSKIQDFYHLSLQVKGISNLIQSFKRFTEPQKIEDYKCETCMKKSIITKQTSLMELPQILIINLQRIIFDLDSREKVKVHSQLQFPEHIDLDQCRHKSSRSKNSQFKLKGVVIHSGTSQGGHYYSIIKFEEDWYKFDDDNISKVGFEDLKELSYGGKTNGLVYDRMHSTNAYILFYEQQKKNGINFGSAETVDSLNNGLENQYQRSVGTDSIQQAEKIGESYTTQQSFKSEVLHQNKSFYLESQIHQPSFFESLNKIYAFQRPKLILNPENKVVFYQDWRLVQTQTFYEELLQIYLKSLKFFAYCYKLPDFVFTDTTIAICELIILLPQKTEDFFRQEVDEKFWTEIMCSHDDQRVREMYKQVMTKAVFVYCNYFSFNLKPFNYKGFETTLKSGQFASTRRFQQILTFFINSLSSQLVLNHIYKCYYFFQLLQNLLDTDERILKLAIQSKVFSTLLELLMANQSANAEKDKIRPDLPYEHAVPLLKCVNRLIRFKKNLTGSVLFRTQNFSQKFYTQLSENEAKTLSSVTFYKRMMKFKYDDRSLPLIVACMCYKDKSLSTTFSRFLLTCMNDLYEVDNISSLFSNISTFLRIEDEYQMHRLEGVLGLAQIYSYKKLNNHVVSYGLGYSSSSKVIKYYSAVCFSEDEKMKPLLELLHDKRQLDQKYEAKSIEFEISGVNTLLQLIAQFPLITKYILSLPPPSYFYVNYLTWVQDYIEKNLREESNQRESLFFNSFMKMKELLEIIERKMMHLHEMPQIPVMKQIIGRNKNVESLQVKTDRQQNYEIRVYSHETYVLDNIPVNGNENFSLPDSVFRNKHENSYAYYFIENSNIKKCDIEVKSQNTLISIFISSLKPLVLRFALSHFSHEIYVRKGQSRINFGYTTEKLQDYLKVQVLEDDQVKSQPQPQLFTFYTNEKLQRRDRTNSINSVKSEIHCPQCTYLNKMDAYKCEICDVAFS